MRNPSTSSPRHYPSPHHTTTSRPIRLLPAASGWWASVLISFRPGIVNWPDAFFPFFTFRNPNEFEIHADSLSRIFFRPLARFAVRLSSQYNVVIQGDHRIYTHFQFFIQYCRHIQILIFENLFEAHFFKLERPPTPNCVLLFKYWIFFYHFDVPIIYLGRYYLKFERVVSE